MRNWQAWTCTLITFTGSGTIRSSIKQLQCNAYYFTGPKYRSQQSRNLGNPYKMAAKLCQFRTLIAGSGTKKLVNNPGEDFGRIHSSVYRRWPKRSRIEQSI